MVQKLPNGPALGRVLDEALLDEIGEHWAPFLGYALDRLMYHCIEQIFYRVSSIAEGGLSFGKLECKTAKRPHINLFGVGVTLSDLGRDPTRCASLRLPILVLLRQENAEAQI